MDFIFIRYAFVVNRLNPIKNQTIDISSRQFAIFFSRRRNRIFRLLTKQFDVKNKQVV